MPSTEHKSRSISWHVDGENVLAQSLHVTGLSYLVEPLDYFKNHRCSMRLTMPDGFVVSRLLKASSIFQECQLAAEEFDHGFAGSTSDLSKDVDFHPSEPVGRWLSERETDVGRAVQSHASYFTAVKEANKQNKDGTFTINIKIKAEEVPIWLMNAPMGEELLIGAIDRGQGTDDTLAKEMSDRADDARRKMVSFSHDPVFQQWLAERYDHWQLVSRAMLQDSQMIEDAVVETIRRISGIASRRQFSCDRAALEKFEALMAEFYRDMSVDFRKRKK